MWTVGCFVVPVFLYLTWALTRSSSPTPGCVDDAGDPCPSPRAGALAALADTAVSLAGALALALLAVLVLRRIAPNWRASTVGIAAAVIGAGIATALAAALS